MLLLLLLLLLLPRTTAVRLLLCPDGCAPAAVRSPNGLSCDRRVEQRACTQARCGPCSRSGSVGRAVNSGKRVRLLAIGAALPCGYWRFGVGRPDLPCYSHSLDCYRY